MKLLRQNRGDDERDERRRHASAHLRKQEYCQQREHCEQHGPCIRRVDVGDESSPLLDERRRHVSHAQSQEVLDLAREDYHRDAARESHYDGVRNELDRRPELRDSHHDQDYPRHEGRDYQSIDAVLLDDAVDDDDERPGRAADLDSRTPQRRYEESGYYGRPEPASGGDAARDREGDCEGKRDDADEYSGGEIVRELLAIVVAERGYEFGD